MASIEISLIFGVLLLLVHYFSDRAQNFYLKHKKSVTGFSGGIFLSYIALHIFPAIYQVEGKVGKLSFLSVLGGMGLFFVLDRHISKHKMKYKVRAEIREEHAVSLFVYHIIIGIAFIAFSPDILNLLIFFVPLALFTAFSSLSMTEIYEIEHENDALKIILSASTLIGILLATIIPISRVLYYPLLGFVGGSIAYLILTDITKEAEKKSFYFVWGVLLYSGIISLVWLFV